MFTPNFLTLQSNWNQRQLPADNGPLFLAPYSLSVLGLTALLQAENCSKGDEPGAAQPGGSQQGTLRPAGREGPNLGLLLAHSIVGPSKLGLTLCA